MLMAFLKGSDTRKDASFVVNPVRVIPEAEDEDEEEDEA